MPSMNSTGYGPSNMWQNLVFDGNEKKFELWETKLLGYMKLKKLKKVFNTDEEISGETNETAFAELIQFLDERSLTLVMREAQDDGRKAWKILKEHYASNSKPRIITLYNELTTLKKNHSEPITDYLLRAENAATSLRAVKEQVSDSLLIAMVLKGLSDEYKAFVAVTTQAENVDDFVKFKTSLKHFEETENLRTQSNPDQASIMKLNAQEGKKSVVCYSCGTPGHKSTNCDKRKSRWCSICKNKTHNTNKCRKKKDSANKTSVKEENHSFAFKASDTKSSIEASSDTFLVDCGATTHIVNNKSCFIDTDPTFKSSDHYIELADGTTVNGVAKEKGTIVTKFRTSEDEFVEVKLKDVLYIPNFPQCIFSVKSATSHGCKVIFSEDKDELIAPNGTIFPIFQEKRLYYLCKSAVNSKRTESLQTWHRILGHCNTTDILKMESVVQGMKIDDNQSKFDCETCVMAKQPNTRNRDPDIRATEPFELIHTDLAGPVDPIAKDGFRYAIVFTDDYSGNMFTYFLKEKSDATRATEKFLADVAPYGKVKTLSFHEDIFPSGETKRLRSDNGGEFISQEFSDLLIKNKIKHEKSSPYSPHQNGTAERSWRTLFEMTRSLLLEAGLPKNLWTYAVMTATHIRNRCYSQRIKNTPYGLITGIKPDVARLQVFGSVCYPITIKPKKLDPRASKGVFVGYDRDSPSYLVYDPETKAVSKHRLVRFFPTINQLPVTADVLPVTDEPTTKPEPSDEKPTTATAKSEPRKAYPLRSCQQPSIPDEPKDEPDETDAAKFVHYCYHINTPSTFKEALSCPEANQWKQAMDNEFESLKSNQTFIEKELPSNKSLVGGRWVFNLKGDPKNPTFKARFVAKGYSQIEGIDYHETFSPTARMETVRTLIQVAAHHDLDLQQMDVKTAFLHAPIEEEIYVNAPEGYKPTNPALVWKLQKSLYGLKQSGRNWNTTFHDHLKDNGFAQSTADPCLFTKFVENSVIYLLVWVDDIVLASNDPTLMTDTKSHLSRTFKMTDLGVLAHFLGIDFRRINGQIFMSQEEYILKILTKFGMSDCKPRATPCEQNPNAYEKEGDEPIDQTSYRQMVGSLIYAMVCTRPDLSYVVTKLSQKLSCPTAADLMMLKHVFRYLKKTSDYCLIYSKSTTDLQIFAYCDADWAASKDRRSISGYCISLNPNGPLVSWKSKRQNSIALSTCEAEYVAMSIACQEVIYMKESLLVDIFGVKVDCLMSCDNQGAIALSKNPVKHSKAKHIDIRYHFVRECHEKGLLDLKYVPSDSNYADIFTKPPKKFLLEKFITFIFGN